MTGQNSSDSSLASRQSRIWPFIRLGRPKFIIYALILQALGAACAVRLGDSFNFVYFALGQLQISSAHLMTHFLNEYYDFETDSRNRSATGWTGGSGVLVEGHFQPRVALITGLSLAIFSVVLLAFLASYSPHFTATLPIVLFVLVTGWAYSARPIALHSRGLGEFTVMSVVALLTPIYGFILQHGSFQGADQELLLVLIPVGITQFARMIIMNIPDREADESVGKRTLIVRIGVPRGAQLYLALITLAYASLIPLAYYGLPTGAVIGMLVPAPLGFSIGLKLLRGDWRDVTKMRKLPFLATIYVILVALCCTIGLLAGAHS